MPPAASQAFKDFGLSTFVAAVGLDSGVQALLTVKESGITLLLLGIFVTLFPMILSMLFARYVLGYRNAALLAGAMAGSRGASPAFGQVTDKSESSVATVPGSTRLTRTRSGSNSCRNDSLNPFRPNFVKLYPLVPGRAVRPAVELTLTMSATRRRPEAAPSIR